MGAMLLCASAIDSASSTKGEYLIPRTIASEGGDALCKLYQTEFGIIDPSNLPTKFLNKIFESLLPEIRAAAHIGELSPRLRRR